MISMWSIKRTTTLEMRLDIIVRYEKLKQMSPVTTMVMAGVGTNRLSTLIRNDYAMIDIKILATVNETFDSGCHVEHIRKEM
jgi:hypothetical protein